MRDSVVFYRSFYEAIKDLPDADLAKSFKAIMEYGLNGTAPTTAGIEKTIYLLTKPQIDANNRRWENGKQGGRPTKKSKDDMEESKRARNSYDYIKWRDSVYERDSYTCQMCGSKNKINAHHKKNFDDFPDLRFDIDNGITLCEKCHAKVHKEHSDNLRKTENNLDITVSEPKEKVNVKEKVKENVKESIGRFAPPTLEDVIGYCQEKGYKIDAERFIDFYSAKGWMIGKNKMKDWKAAVRNWARSQRQESTTKAPAKNGFHNFDQRDTDYDALVMDQVKSWIDEGG